MTTHHIVFKDIFKSAWVHVKDNAWYIACVGVGALIISGAVHSIDILAWIVNLAISISIITPALVIVSGKKPVLEDLIKSFRSYGSGF